MTLMTRTAPVLRRDHTSERSSVPSPDRMGLITVGIADDEILIRTGVRGVLDRAAEIVVVGEAKDGHGAVDLVRTHRPRVLLLDAVMPGTDALAALRVIRRHSPLTRVVMLANPAAGDLLLPALRAGAVGFLPKTGRPEELVNAVRVVAAGTPSCPRRPPAAWSTTWPAPRRTAVTAPPTGSAP